MKQRFVLLFFNIYQYLCHFFISILVFSYENNDISIMILIFRSHEKHPQMSFDQCIKWTYSKKLEYEEIYIECFQEEHYELFDGLNIIPKLSEYRGIPICCKYNIHTLIYWIIAIFWQSTIWALYIP